jgi:hypothetical protein
MNLIRVMPAKELGLFPLDADLTVIAELVPASHVSAATSGHASCCLNKSAEHGSASPRTRQFVDT